jgi:hypothetical protein
MVIGLVVNHSSIAFCKPNKEYLEALEHVDVIVRTHHIKSAKFIGYVMQQPQKS